VRYSWTPDDDELGDFEAPEPDADVIDLDAREERGQYDQPELGAFYPVIETVRFGDDGGGRL
jgi:hypothetical protein